jgi:hypothetical protein
LAKRAELRRTTIWRHFAGVLPPGETDSGSQELAGGVPLLHAWYCARGGARASGRMAGPAPLLSMEAGFGATSSFEAMIQVQICSSQHGLYNRNIVLDLAHGELQENH